ncbi:IS630 transposase-related protein [Arsenophonus endosymbiont of Bemisia tabaci]|uniref:IS630 transposase-related protein n=1 Tax=Arsenophonus endosymbiont of Bemisia tabaci TaxID=536059 RepID=UPI003B845548
MEKNYQFTLPEQIDAVLICPNGNCISNNKPVSSSFTINQRHIAKRLNFDDIIYISYSINFRRKVIFTMEEEGLNIRETTKQFRIGSESVSRWINQI